MKLLIEILLLLLTMQGTKAETYRFRLQGDVIHINAGQVALFSPADSVNALLTAEMSEGLFTLQGRLKEPGLYRLNIAGKWLPIVLDGTDMRLYTDYLEPDTKLLKGSPAIRIRLALERELREKYEARLNEVANAFYASTQEGEGITADAEAQFVAGIRACGDYRKELIREFIKSHPDDLYLPVFMLEEMGKNRAWGREAYELLSPRAKASQPGRLLEEAVRED